VIGGSNSTDISHVGDAGKRFNPAPVLAAIFRYLDQAVIRADVDQPVLLRRFRPRRSMPEERRRSILRHRVHTPDLAHHVQLVAIEPARELSADDLPAIAAI